jgi:hypothetical protein
MIKFGLDGITAFSTVPPTLATWLGSGAEVSSRKSGRAVREGWGK